MKIALIGRYGEGEILPGPERVARELYFQLKNKKINVTFIEYFFSGYSDYSVLKKIFGRKINNDKVFRLGILPLILKLLKEQFEVIHFVNSQRFQLIILLLKPFLEYKIVSTLHGFTRYELAHRKKKSSIDLFLEKMIIKKSDLIIFPSNLLTETFRADYKNYQNKFKVIPNGIGKKFLSVSNSPVYKNEISIIFYNAFDKSINKGLKELGEQLSLIENVKIKLFVLGYEEQVFNKNKNLEIIFAGLLNHDEFIHFCRDKHFIIKAGAFEPYSIIVAECMSLGIIPVITENTGIKDFIKHGFNGFIYNSEVPGNLAELFNDILSTKYSLNSISANAKQTKKEFEWESIFEKYLGAYKSVL